MTNDKSIESTKRPASTLANLRNAIASRTWHIPDSPCSIDLARHSDEPELGTTMVKVHDATNTLDVVDFLHTLVPKLLEVLRHHRIQEPRGHPRGRNGAGERILALRIR